MGRPYLKGRLGQFQAGGLELALPAEAGTPYGGVLIDTFDSTKTAGLRSEHFQVCLLGDEEIERDPRCCADENRVDRRSN